MRIIKWIVGLLVSLVLVVIVVAVALPGDYSVTRSIVINAPAEKIYPLVAAPAEWKKWSVWNQRDPNMELSFSGPASGAGAAWEWKSKSQGNGGMKIVSAQDNQVLNYELHFEGMNSSTGALTFEAQGSATKLTWSMQGNANGKPMMKLFLPFMDKMVGADFDAGLKNLKDLAEKP